MDAFWKEPVVLSMPSEDVKVVASARDAMDSMMYWPHRREKSYRKAVRACLFALVGEKTPDKARKAFVNAAKDVDYLHH